MSPPQDSSWRLHEVSLGKFQDGRFTTFKTAAIVPSSTDPKDPSRKLATVDQSLLDKFGVGFAPDADPEKTKGLTAYFDFVNAGGQQLRTVQNLSSQVKQLRESSGPQR